MATSDRALSQPERTRTAETVLKRLGYSRVAPDARPGPAGAAFWVQEAGVPRRTYPVFVPSEDRAALSDRIDSWIAEGRARQAARRRAIFVAPTDVAADEAWARLAAPGGGLLDQEVSILVMPPADHADRTPHFHLRRADPRELLQVATGVVVGLFRRAQASEGGSQIDFEEMLQLLRGRFGLDVHRSLGVRTDEDALFLLYQLAQRSAYAPGDPGASLHLLVLKPTGPAARLPWFAA